MDTVLRTRNENVLIETHRELGPFEHLLWLVDLWSPRHFIFVSRIEGSSISVESLNAALVQSQRRHPLLRRAIHVNGNCKPEFVPSSLPIWLRVVPRANDTQWLGEVDTQLALPFEMGDGPLLRVVLVQGEGVSELILAIHHSIGDGVSAMYLVRDVLKYMEGYELEELSPRSALEDLLPAAATTPVYQLQRPSISSNGVTRVDRPTKACLQTFSIESGELDRILSRCRQEGTTFQGALLSALLLSLPGNDIIACLAPINVRKLLPNVIDDFGLYISSGVAILNRNLPADFWSFARSARQQVMQAFNPHVLRAKAVAMASVIAGKPSPQTVYEQVWRSFGYNAVLTNLGKFPNTPELKRFRITAVYPILSPELEPVVAVATANHCAYITVSSAPELMGHSSQFLDHLRQHATLSATV